MAELNQRPAKVEIGKMTAKITFEVFIEDLDKYYRKGCIFVEKRERDRGDRKL